MEVKEKKTVDMLTKESVSILTQNFLYDGETNMGQVGENHRKAYVNSESGRADLVASEPDDVSVAVLAIWGEVAVVEENVPEETTTED